MLRASDRIEFSRVIIGFFSVLAIRSSLELGRTLTGCAAGFQAPRCHRCDRYADRGCHDWREP